MEMSGLSRGFSICCLRFKNGVATTPARLASGWLARLYREGVEPSGSLQKVSDHILIPLFWIYPGATKDLPSSLVQLRSAVWTGVTRDTRPTPETQPRIRSEVRRTRRPAQLIVEPRSMLAAESDLLN